MPPHAGLIFTTPRKTIDGSGAAWRLAAIVTKLRSSVGGRQKSTDKMQVLFRKKEGGDVRRRYVRAVVRLQNVRKRIGLKSALRVGMGMPRTEVAVGTEGFRD